jgi:hypothetical protein
LDAEKAITELEVGEALVSLLDEKGRPGVVERAYIVPPGSQLGPITDEERAALVRASTVHGKYETAVDRESAYEKLKGRTAGTPAPQPGASPAGAPQSSPLSDLLFGRTGPRGGKQSQGVLEAVGKSAARAIGSELGRQVIRGVLGSILRGNRH